MPWDPDWPKGSVSVKGNRAPGNQNMSYIQDTMGNVAIGTNAAGTTDHFWNVSSNVNGHHRFIKSPAFTVGGLPADPVFAAGIDSVLYSKLKLAADSTAQQDVQPFFKNNSAIMQILGIRAMAVFNVLLASPFTVTVVYKHNVSSVTRTAKGLFTINFTNTLPSNAYLVSGMAIRNDSSLSAELIMSMQGATSLNTVKSTSLVKVQTKSDGGSVHDPLQAWVFCFGG